MHAAATSGCLPGKTYDAALAQLTLFRAGIMSWERWTDGPAPDRGLLIGSQGSPSVSARYWVEVHHEVPLMQHEVDDPAFSWYAVAERCRIRQWLAFANPRARQPTRSRLVRLRLIGRVSARLRQIAARSRAALWFASPRARARACAVGSPADAREGWGRTHRRSLARFHPAQPFSPTHWLIDAAPGDPRGLAPPLALALESFHHLPVAVPLAGV
jgi:hypothetical protein